MSVALCPRRIYPNFLRSTFLDWLNVKLELLYDFFSSTILSTVQSNRSKSGKLNSCDDARVVRNVKYLASSNDSSWNAKLGPSGGMRFGQICINITINQENSATGGDALSPLLHAVRACLSLKFVMINTAYTAPYSAFTWILPILQTNLYFYVCTWP